MVDSKGVIYEGRPGGFDASKARYAQPTDARTLADVVEGADVFLGCSAPGVLTVDMVKTMAERPIILALANPEPEIRPELAKAARPDCIIATGRSDYPNQVNNVLCFPYIFRGALDCGATKITPEMKLACVRQIADLAKSETSDEVAAAYAGQDLSFGPEYLIPKPFDTRLILRIAPAVAQAAADSGVAARPIADMQAYKESLSLFVYQTGILMRPVINAAKALPDARKRVAYCRRRGRTGPACRPDGAGRSPGPAHPDRTSRRDRGPHREGRPAHAPRGGCGERQPRARPALSPVLGALPPTHGPQWRHAGRWPRPRCVAPTPSSPRSWSPWTTPTP